MQKSSQISRRIAILLTLPVLLTLFTHCMKAERIDTDINGPKGLNNIIGAWAIALLAATEPVYTGGQFVAVGGNGNAWWSNDGANWNAATYTFGDVGIKSLAFSGSLWVGVGSAYNPDTCGVWTSNDGKSWTQGSCIASLTTHGLNAVAYGNGLFLAGGDCSSGSLLAMRSSDGVNWEDASSSVSVGCADGGVSSIVFDEQSGLFIMMDSQGSQSQVVFSSSNGSTWKDQTTGLGINPGTNYLRKGPAGSVIAVINVLDFTELSTGTIDAGSETISWSGGTYIPTFINSSVVYGGNQYSRVYSNSGSSDTLHFRSGASLSSLAGALPDNGNWLPLSDNFSYSYAVLGHSSSLSRLVMGFNSGGNATQFIYSDDSGITWQSGTADTTNIIAVNAIGVAK